LSVVLKANFIVSRFYLGSLSNFGFSASFININL
jgi:hypothetical protein